MENMLNYVHLRKDIPFSFRPLNWVDLLILNELSYVDWIHIVLKRTRLLTSGLPVLF